MAKASRKLAVSIGGGRSAIVCPAKRERQRMKMRNQRKRKTHHEWTYQYNYLQRRWCCGLGHGANGGLRDAERPSRDANDQLGPQLRRVSLQMRNAQRRRCWPVPNSGGFPIRIESQTQTQEAEGRGYLLSKRRLKASLDLLVRSRWR